MNTFCCSGSRVTVLVCARERHFRFHNHRCLWWHRYPSGFTGSVDMGRQNGYLTQRWCLAAVGVGGGGGGGGGGNTAAAATSRLGWRGLGVCEVAVRVHMYMMYGKWTTFTVVCSPLVDHHGCERSARRKASRASRASRASSMASRSLSVLAPSYCR